MQRLNHLFELTDTHFRCIRICRIAAFGNVVVHRVITPIIAVISQFCLVYRTVIVRRQNLNMRHPQFLQMVDSGQFSFGRNRAVLGQSEELTFVLNTRRRMDAEIAVMKFIHNCVRGMIHCRPFVFLPALGIRLSEIDNRTALAVHANGCCEDTRSLV